MDLEILKQYFNGEILTKLIDILNFLSNYDFENENEIIKKASFQFNFDFGKLLKDNCICFKKIYYNNGFESVKFFENDIDSSFFEINFNNSSFYNYLSNSTFIFIVVDPSTNKIFNFFPMKFNKIEIGNARIVYDDTQGKVKKANYNLIKESYNFTFYVDYENSFNSILNSKLFFYLNKNWINRSIPINIRNEKLNNDKLKGNSLENDIDDNSILSKINLNVNNKNIVFLDYEKNIWSNIPLSYYGDIPNKCKKLISALNIKTIKELCNFPYNKLTSLEGYGETTVNKLLNFLKKYVLVNNNDSTKYAEMTYNNTILDVNHFIKAKDKINIIEYIKNNKIPRKAIFFKGDFETILEDFFINDVENISLRLKNCLENNDIKTLKNVIFFKGDISKIDNMGTKTFNELLQIIENRIILDKDFEIIPDTVNEIINNFIDSNYDKFIFYNKTFFKNILFKEFNFSNELDISWNSISFALINSDKFLTYLKGVIVSYLNYYKFVDYQELLIFLRSFLNYEIINKVIFETLKSNNSFCLLFNNDLCLKLPTILEIVNKLDDEKTKEILKKRLSNQTLDEIGKTYSLTRERVRQISSPWFKSIKKCMEFYYEDIFKKYEFNEESFCQITKLNIESYYFMCECFNKGKNNVFELYRDIVPNHIKKNAIEFNKKYCFFVDGVFVLRKRSSVLKHLIDSFCYEEISLDKFEKIYNDFRNEHNLTGDEFIFTPRYMENKLSSSPNILWKYKKNFRKFDIINFDMEKLMEFININNYNNKEISTDMFFKDDSLKNEFDIWDSYELHNLLKKYFDLYPESNQWNIKFNRMPNIQIGEANRYNQILQLLFQEAPITKENFSLLYSEIYGTKPETVTANLLPLISNYYDGDLLKVDFLDITEKEFDFLSEIIKLRIHSYDEIKSIIIKCNPTFDLNKINNFTLDKLGFKPYENVIVPKIYNSFDKAIRDEIFSKDTVNFNSDYKFLWSNNSFLNIRNELEKNLVYVEFSKKEFVRVSKLVENGITIELIRDFINKAISFSEGNLFTIHYLKKLGFNHEIFKFGFDDIFYNNLIKTDESIKYRKLGSESFLFKVSDNQIQTKDLLEYILQHHFQSIKLYDLINFVKDEYGLDIDKWSIILKMSKESIWYDQIYDKVYINYNEYLKELNKYEFIRQSNNT